MDRERLLDDLKHDEGLSVEAYPDGDGYSIGYGHHSDDIQGGRYMHSSASERLA